MEQFIEDYPDIFEGIDKSWDEFFNKDNVIESLNKILPIVLETDKLCPERKNIFNALRLTPLTSVKVIIIGQDPYPKITDAHGLSFSSLAKTIPASLQNIYRCLINSKLIDKTPTSSDLTSWAKQGILLLNASLTTCEKTPGFHTEYWKPFTEILMTYINSSMKTRKNEVCVMLWGNDAKLYDTKFKNCIIYKWSHPSPMSDNRITDKSKKFTYMTHFKEISEKYPEIIWNPFTLDKSQSATQSNTQSADHTAITKLLITSSKEKREYTTLSLFTDGACTNNKRGARDSAGGWGIYCVETNLRVAGRIDEEPTNQVAELTAVLNALKYIIYYMDENPELYINVKLLSDSEYCYWIVYHSINNWCKKPISKSANLHLVKQVDEYVKTILQRGVIDFIHISAHTSKPPKDSLEYYYWHGNDIVDQLAVIGCTITGTYSNRRKLGKK